MRRAYAILDVFTAEALSGNPLAVVLDGAGLETAQMQAIAREFNLSETVFVLPAQNPVHSAQLRIFTPNRELPFAGHPTVGTAVLLASSEGEQVPEERDAMKDFRPGSAGTGLQMAIHDLDGDGDLDIVAPGKSGLYWFENPRHETR